MKVVKVGPRLDAHTAPLLEAELGDDESLLFDLGALGYVSSPGLHLLHSRGGRCFGASPLVQEIVAASLLPLQLFPSEAEARAAGG